MPPAEIAEEANVVTNTTAYVDLTNGPLKQKGTVVRLSQDTTSVTFTCWLRLENAKNYCMPLPSVFPKESVSTGQKYPCQTIYGPTSGSGTTTLPITVPDASTLPSHTLAFNLTTEAEATLSAGYASKSLHAGETLGSHIKAKPGASITLTTTGTWALELAIPPQELVYYFTFNQAYQTYLPIFPADNQWALVAAHLALDTDTGKLSFTYRTLYADGCQVDYANGAEGTTPYYSITTSTNCSLQTIPSGAIITPFALYAGAIFTPPDASAPALAHAYGLKAYRGEISDNFLQTIRTKDAAEMVKRGLLTPADCTHETTAASSTFSLRTRARSLPKTHTPGNPPPLPTETE